MTQLQNTGGLLIFLSNPFPSQKRALITDLIAWLCTLPSGTVHQPFVLIIIQWISLYSSLWCTVNLKISDRGLKGVASNFPWEKKVHGASLMARISSPFTLLYALEMHFKPALSLENCSGFRDYGGNRQQVLISTQTFFVKTLMIK